jgi:hypothetical protein
MPGREKTLPFVSGIVAEGAFSRPSALRIQNSRTKKVNFRTVSVSSQGGWREFLCENLKFLCVNLQFLCVNCKFSHRKSLLTPSQERILVREF